MTYQTGTSSSAVDLLDKFRVFAIAQGWAVNRWVAAGSGYELCISKGSAYFNFRAWDNENMLLNGLTQSGTYGITMNGSDGYDALLAWDRQPGYPMRGSGGASDQYQTLMPCHVNVGPFPAYYFFSPDAKTLYCELEQTTGTFVRFGCGSLDLFNLAAPGGGRFVYATSSGHVTSSTGSTSEWLGTHMDATNDAPAEMVPFRGADFQNYNNGRGCASAVRVTFATYDNWAVSCRDPATTALPMAGCQGGGVHDKVLRDSGASPLNGVGLLLPNIVSYNAGNEFFVPIGTVPGLRYMDMTMYQPGDEFSIGLDTWKVFPWYQKGGLSLQRGIAYLKAV